VRSAQEHAVAGLAQSEHADPAVDLPGLDPGVNLGRDKRQPEANQEALDHIIPHSSYLDKKEQTEEEIDADQADECRQVGHGLVHFIILSLLIQRHELDLLRKAIGSCQVVVAVHKDAAEHEHRSAPGSAGYQPTLNFLLSL
jgi:hypothetical protein